jgi:hypothetical protein
MLFGKPNIVSSRSFLRAERQKALPAEGRENRTIIKFCKEANDGDESAH